jgi:putative alpha-1,2-mannosidase
MQTSFKTWMTFFCYSLLRAGYAQSPAEQVNPFIGTDNYGNTHPGATLPWGMVSVCPFNVTEKTVAFDGKGVKTSSYVYGGGRITGFAHVNLSGVGCPDHGVIQLMPARGNIRELYRDHSSAYRDEKARPGYYAVFLDDYGISAEMTATLRTGFIQVYLP